jgi:hypothetical protein
MSGDGCKRAFVVVAGLVHAADVEFDKSGRADLDCAEVWAPVTPFAYVVVDNTQAVVPFPLSTAARCPECFI